ncbi:MAG: Guanine deaminase [Chlamydiae bacterium]|nr:Guanine deaminase [Chlamydiota bacterium]
MSLWDVWCYFLVAKGNGSMDFIKRTIELAKENVEEGGRPFACVIAKDGKILAEAANQVAQTHDPTAHAEMLAIRKVSQILQSEHFTGCEFFILAHPCPMCLAAMYYCSPDRVTFITTRDDYASHYVDDRKYFTLLNFYEEIGKPWQDRKMPMCHHPDPQGIEVYKLWKKRNSS